eukprot:TRINITY_DN9141_c0_g1_i1.p1 TRINITY_DN9141_c0_g1~~TRINITY_DN9141_c0_g1_i1.p1  ORF type:complete len:380 (+),score=75.53 TRINITY_DN9141_c0_g1_i1:141-1280(+)
MIRRPPRSTLSSSSAASDVYKRQDQGLGDPSDVITLKLVLSVCCKICGWELGEDAASASMEELGIDSLDGMTIKSHLNKVCKIELGILDGATLSEIAAEIQWRLDQRVGREPEGPEPKPNPSICLARQHSILERDARDPRVNLEPVGGISACARGDLLCAVALQQTGWDPHHAVDKWGTTGLMWAAGGGHLELVQWLVSEQGVAADKTDKKGRTALMWAAKHGQLPVLQWLVEEARADVDALMPDGSNCFDWAVLSGHLDAVLFLRDYVDIYRRNAFGCTCVHWAAISGSVECCRALREWGLDFGSVNDAGHGFVIKAGWRGLREVLEWGLVDPDGPGLWDQLVQTEARGLTAIELAYVNGHREVAKWMQGLVHAATAQ